MRRRVLAGLLVFGLTAGFTGVAEAAKVTTNGRADPHIETDKSASSESSGSVCVRTVAGGSVNQNVAPGSVPTLAFVADAGLVTLSVGVVAEAQTAAVPPTWVLFGLALGVVAVLGGMAGRARQRRAG